MAGWRLITDEDVRASFGLAADETLTERVGAGESPPLLRLYTYSPMCALVGRFQNVEHEVRVEYCQAHGIPINRRPTGGGAIVMGAGQLGLALIVSNAGEQTYFRARDLMAEYARGLVQALRNMGAAAQLRGKNDIEVGGRKIAGLGIYRAPNAGLLFHASLLVDLDLELMIQALRLPIEKLSDKAIETFSARLTTVRREISPEIDLPAVRREVVRGYQEALGLDLQPSTFTPAELAAIDRLEREKYLTPGWVFQTTGLDERLGKARKKTPAGLLDVTVARSGASIKALYLQGDFFAEDRAINAVEAALRWHSADPELVAATLRQVYAAHATEFNQVPLEALEEVILNALWQADQAPE